MLYFFLLLIIIFYFLHQLSVLQCEENKRVFVGAVILNDGGDLRLISRITTTREIRARKFNVAQNERDK